MHISLKHTFFALHVQLLLVGRLVTKRDRLSDDESGSESSMKCQTNMVLDAHTVVAQDGDVARRQEGKGEGPAWSDAIKPLILCVGYSQ